MPSTTVTTPQEQLIIGSPERFFVDPYTVVEIGHGEHPIWINNPSFYETTAKYIGVESWLRCTKEIGDLLVKEALQHPAAKVGFQKINASLEVYDPTTELPSGLAHEVVLSNVFTDPQIADNSEHTQRLLQEVSRLLDPDTGIVVLRETLTPEIMNIDEFSLFADKAGLEVAGIEKNGGEFWLELERLYCASGYGGKRNSFYMFLQNSKQLL
ncbi:TPA: hypothetical protein EYO12_02105 [Candidatus Saccharibacteria bacterium]|nr:hypothetical protein [Candidatus Saccharibacteria bacterium]HIO87510.1 hypothetical protein [Candidatus Saccharibacteria bacterium]